jgi:hypothetical protein
MVFEAHTRNESDRSDDEKVAGRPFETIHNVDLPADPDSHLSAAERAAIVCFICSESID